MSKLVLVARILLGLVFTVFSLNFFIPFMPPPELSGPAADFMGALMATGYIFPVVKIVELVSGIMLLGGVMVPLALTLLAPIIINIALFHFTLSPGEWWMSVLLLVLEIFLVWAYRDSFKGVLEVRATPNVG